MTTFNEGDRVRVYNPDGWDNGKVGTVKSHHPNGMVILIFDASPRDHVSAVPAENLRIVLTEEQEIEKIAEALLLADRNAEWPWSKAFEVATGMYKAGVRHHG